MGEEKTKVKANMVYSEAFKRQVVGEIASGRHTSPHAARKAYGINGADTVDKWVRKYGREDLLPKRVRIETMQERDELKEAHKRIRILEAAVADAHIDCCLEKAFLKVACDRLGDNPENFKKKHPMTLSELRRTRGLT